MNHEFNRTEDSTVCANCGAALDLQSWTPTEIVESDGETLEILSFCDDVCRNEWVRDD